MTLVMLSDKVWLGKNFPALLISFLLNYSSLTPYVPTYTIEICTTQQQYETYSPLTSSK